MFLYFLTLAFLVLFAKFPIFFHYLLHFLLVFLLLYHFLELLHEVSSFLCEFFAFIIFLIVFLGRRKEFHGVSSFTDHIHALVGEMAELPTLLTRKHVCFVLETVDLLFLVVNFSLLLLFVLHVVRCITLFVRILKHGQMLFLTLLPCEWIFENECGRRAIWILSVPSVADLILPYRMSRCCSISTNEA